MEDGRSKMEDGRSKIEQQQVLMAKPNGAEIETYEKALDDLVNVNSLFTLAVFVGLSFANPSQLISLENRPECNADSDMAKNLVVYEVVSFALFLLSSLVAKTLKVLLRIYRKEDLKKHYQKDLFTLCKHAMMSLSALGSILGCIFLTISMVQVIQIKIGKLSCGSLHADRAVASLVSIVALALFIYASTMIQAILRSIQHDSKKHDPAQTQTS